MKIDGYTRVCGLIGNPVEHTMSPVIHRYLAEKTSQNMAYVPMRVEHGKLEDAVKGAFALNVLGLNITVPYKTEVIPYLSSIDDAAKQIGAVNTLVRTREGFKGYNTDMPGLYRAMLSDGVKLDGESVLVLGAGGVARAVLMMLVAHNIREVIVINRTKERAEAVADEVNVTLGRKIVRTLALTEYNSLPADRKYLAIQATNVGMFPHDQETLIEEEGFYKKIHTGYDLIFNPFETKFMKLTREAGGKAFNGLKMLLYQGIIAYELWTGESITEDMARGCYEEVCENMHMNNGDSRDER